MIKELFLKMYVGKATHCRTEELAQEFVDLANSFGLGWGYKDDDENRYTRFDSHQENTTYFVKRTGTLSFGNIGYSREMNYKIIEFTGINNQSKGENSMKVKEFENDGKVMNITVSRMMRKLGIKNVVFNEEKKTTVVFLISGGMGISKMAENESFDPIVALSVAYTLAVATNGNKKNFKENVAKMFKRFRV